MINDVSEAFDGWLETVTGSRRTGETIKGRWVEGTPTKLSFQGVVQNASPEDLKTLPEGNRSDEVIKIHSVFRLIAFAGKDSKGDIINYDGHQFLVMSLANRKIGNYNKAMAVKL